MRKYDKSAAVEISALSGSLKHVFRKHISYEKHLFCRKVENLLYISEVKQKILKNFFFSYIIAFELLALNSHYYEENTYHRQSIY